MVALKLTGVHYREQSQSQLFTLIRGQDTLHKKIAHLKLCLLPLWKGLRDTHSETYNNLSCFPHLTSPLNTPVQARNQGADSDCSHPLTILTHSIAGTAYLPLSFLLCFPHLGFHHLWTASLLVLPRPAAQHRPKGHTYIDYRVMVAPGVGNGAALPTAFLYPGLVSPFKKQIWLCYSIS